jgi:hypothetical protein
VPGGEHRQADADPACADEPLRPQPSALVQLMEGRVS